jgi:hypothetical protein
MYVVFCDVPEEELIQYIHKGYIYPLWLAKLSDKPEMELIHSFE